MISLVIKKRTISLIVLGLLGLALLTTFLLGNLFSNKSPSQEIPTANYSTGVVTIKDVAPPKSSLPAGDDFFVEYKLERERTRGQSVEWLREVINNNNSTSDARQKAQEHLMAISRNMQKESELESLLKAKGFRDAAVLVDDRAVTVVVGAAYLSTGESSQIIDLVVRGTGVDSQNIVIITKT
ncbi:SpoIIIAH-like family protein [Pelotomaculum propionicicum]|uniref:Stage III sporulation protein AH n=1 Tax=Pelotomaculum propionicicum TaxID=258475 RepID=A0A4Y7RJB4_9FIRM|nr:SpoIIIAH-like family protein [Pelotomaculum propionicicum]NLI11990.1 SpoIIIAH-like family protein [Peptococcaceae bacterium]TEB08923.1 Stage III sporulation protein AH [Pelotomaculum propionicicum]